MFCDYSAFTVEFSCNDWEQEWHISAVPDEIWNWAPQDIYTDLLIFRRDYYRHMVQMEEERLEAIRQQERIIRLAVLFVEDRKKRL